jgi:hypothetical protein
MEIEESKGIERKRSDLRVYDANDKLVLAGEVKLPGTPEGRNAYNAALVEDSYQKASNAGAEFFFTWNVNKLVLFDSKQWQKPIMERRLKDYDLGLDLENPEDVSRAEVEKAVREFLARFFAEFQGILAGQQPGWGMAPDEFFVRAFESHIFWPVKLTAEFLWAGSAKSKAFDSLLQEWMANDQGWAVIRNDPKAWRALVDRAARTLCYVFANRLLFYESVRTKFEELDELHVPKEAASAGQLYLHFQKMFQLAVDATGDYETLFYPAEQDWAGPHIFGHEHSLEAWRSVLENLRPFNFKAIRADKPFCELPQGLRGQRVNGPVFLPSLNAVVGNPPYVRQELIPRRDEKPKPKPMQAKEDLLALCSELWPGLKLSGRSDLHCYFWPAAACHLADGGWLGFLVSSSWLDVEYGFALQEWILANFKIHAILESNAEPWFGDARVKTCAVILQRCGDAAARSAQQVKFARLNAPLAQILGERKNENARQEAAGELRDVILRCKKNQADGDFRIVVKRQEDLWQDGLRAGRLFELQRQRNLAQGIRSVPPLEGEDGSEDGGVFDEKGNGLLHDGGGIGYGSRYGGGKWGKYLRAPSLYFQIMDRYGRRFVPLGEITTIRFGVKSGCDAFFMPRDVSAEFLKQYSQLGWNDAPLHTHCKRSEVESGKVRLVKTGGGDETVHPVEAEYLVPEVHSLMNVSRPAIRAKDLDRLMLFVSRSTSELKGTYLLKYLRYGEQNAFASTKSEAVPVAQRSTCASRNPWYNLTSTRPGAFFWPMAQQYRHVIPANPEKLVCNHNLFDVQPHGLSETQTGALLAVVNSTLVANFKTFYGRYAGTEGNLKTEVVDVNLLEVPDPRNVTKTIARKLRDAFGELRARDTQPMVEERFMECRSYERIKRLAEDPVELPQELRMSDRRALDLAVFELLGVAEAAERERLCDELYYETAKHFRQIRIMEVRKQEQRAKTEGREFRADELAADLWDGLSEEDKRPLVQWIAAQVNDGAPVNIPEGVGSLPDANDFLDANTVFFRVPHPGKTVSQPCPLPSRAHAETVHLLSRQGIHGPVILARTEKAARTLQARITQRLAAIVATATALSRSRTADEKKALDLARLLEFWMLHGKPTRDPASARGPATSGETRS